MATIFRYRSFTPKEKFRITEEAENIGNRAAGREYDVSESCIHDWNKNKMRLQETNSNHRAFCSQKANQRELERRLCNYVDDKRQHGCAVTSEICQLKALAITKELGITGFKATLSLCQVAASERVPTWLIAGIGTAWQWPTMHSTRRPRWPQLAWDKL